MATQNTLRLFNLDLHISVIEDIKDICSRVFPEGTVEITNWSLSGHNWVFNKPNVDVKQITADTWMDIDEAMIEAFQKEYDDELKLYDGFIVTHTPVFALLFEKYNKPILIVNTCRYDQPFCMNNQINSPMKHILDESLRRMSQSGQSMIVSNNRYDHWYLEVGCGVKSIYLSSLCLYTNATYQPTKPTFVLYGHSTNPPKHPLLVERPKEGYSWSELFSYKGIVHLPYEMSTMSLFEQVHANVPIWVPTPRFYMECIANGTMEFITFYHVQKDQDFTEQDVLNCFERSDIYNTPGLMYYDSYEDLYQQLEQFDDKHHDIRKQAKEQTIRMLLYQWKNVLTTFLSKHESQSHTEDP
jgi:hypothetical protein